jgi:hypothetical protein
VSEANESQTSYSVEQADIFQYQSYSHSDDIFIILKSTIKKNTSIFVFSREKLHIKGRSPYNGRLSDFSFYIDSQISVHRKFKN